MSQMQYQKDLSLQSPILLDRNHKQIKVEKMLAIMNDADLLGRPLAVDIGCSGGFFSAGLAPHFDKVLGLDIDTHALGLAIRESVHDNIGFVLGDSMQLPLPDNCVDVVVCNHVYEHVPDPARLFDEIHRVLKPGGTCYLGAASRLTLIEPHYHLPFLSWLPKPLAHRYMRLTGKGDHYYETLRTHAGIMRLVSRFEVVDYTLRVVAEPDRFRARDMLPENGWLVKVPLVLWKALYRLLPSYILLLRKSHS